MPQIIRQQTFERSTEWGGGEQTQICNYCPISKIVTVQVSDKTLSLPLDEWQLLVSLINTTLAVDGSETVNSEGI